MTRAPSEPAVPHRTAAWRFRPSRAAALGLVTALVLAACGGDDDGDGEGDVADAGTTTVVAAATTTVAAVTTTTAAPTTTTTIAYVTEGAIVLVANASGIDGAAGRMTDRLAAVGFEMAPATNSGGTVGQLGTSQVLHVPDDPAALAVAESIREALGGGDIEVAEVGAPAPTESGDLGDATVLVMMGNDVADKSLEELQGLAPAPTQPADTSPADTSSPATTTGDTSTDTTDPADG